jgi:hypothetical protein
MNRQPMIDQPLAQPHRRRLHIEAGCQLVNQSSPHRLGGLLGLESAMPPLPPLTLGSTWQVDYDVPERRLPTVLADLLALMDVALHQ